MNEREHAEAIDRRGTMVAVWMAFGVGTGLIFGTAFSQIAGR